MKSNIGSIDKLVRILIAALALLLYFTHLMPGSSAIILLVVAAILLLTSFFNFCPIWHFLGISTKKKRYIKQQEKLN
ncbi:MAG: DUF2892 domain-containing protein [Ginsengibacter sp.]